MLILASSSPRRKEILKMISDDFVVIPSTYDESDHPDLNQSDLAYDLARLKAYDVYRKHVDDTVLACDTIVIISNSILGKPKDKADAIRTLHQLSGNTHQVISGIVVRTHDTTHFAYDTTNVYFNNLSDQTILDYVASGRPMDKAGSYGIQDHDVNLVDHIDGDYDNVVGLPLHCLAKLLDMAGIPHKALQ